MTDALDTAVLERFATQRDPVAAPDFADVVRRATPLQAPARGPRRRRRRLVIAIAVVALVVAGTATAVGRHFFGTAVNYTVVPLTSAGTVPGLEPASPILPVTLGPSPTTGECTAAWNDQAPAETRHWLGAQRLSGVRVGVAMGRATIGGRFGPLCHVWLYLAGGQSVLASGPWTPDGVPRWQGSVLTIPAQPRSMLVSRANAVADSGGTITCRERCDLRAASPAPSAPPAAATGAVRDACALLSSTEVAAILGRAPEHRSRSGGPGSCTWYSRELTSPASTTMLVAVVRLPKAEFEQAMARNGNARRLDGLGEAAYVFRDGDLIVVWDKGFAVTIGNHTDTPLETGQRIGRAVLARL